MGDSPGIKSNSNKIKKINNWQEEALNLLGNVGKKPTSVGPSRESRIRVRSSAVF